MANSRRPVLIDVAGGDERQSLPGAVWLPGAGVCDRDNPSIQARFEARIAELTGNDKSRPVVVFCHHRNCWLSYNAAIRLVRAGYTDVAWFRDGTDGYARAGGRLERAARGW
jgi:PQQ-dependent catabolism-associated CXXCW motif protein